MSGKVRARNRYKCMVIALAAMLAGLTGCGRTGSLPVSPDASGEPETVVDPETEETGAGPAEMPETAAAWDAGTDAGKPDVVLDDACGTTYEIFVYSFADSDGDGIGDLNGIRERLDYLNDGDPATREDLGVNALWLTPVFPSPTYHKYDATDYCGIDPQFGTLADLDSLLAACHDRGMRLYLDIAFNHTSDRHFWFTEAADAIRTAGGQSETGEEILNEASSRCPYVSYYNFSRESRQGYEPLPGTGWYYEARFWSGMPDLNLDNERVRQELADILGFWLARGVDGFRLDAVTSYYTDDREKTGEFLKWLQETARERQQELSGRDVYLVGEAWENQDAYAKLYESGVDSFFDFAFAGQEGTIAQIVRSGKNGQKYAQRMAEEEELYASYSDSYINAPFYTNHDMARSAGYYAKDGKNRVKLAMALNLLQTGNAFVYYGEELGMRGSGRDENKRAPFPWGDHDKVCAGPPDMESFDAAPFGSLAGQRDDPDSVYGYIREAIHLRARHPLIARGRTVPVPEDSETGRELKEHPALCAFLRTGGKEAAGGGDARDLLIIVNTGSETVTLPTDRMELADSLSTGGEQAALDADGRLTLPGYGVAVLK